ncbi:MAG: phosphotransferase [Proteobacteria bacterium]|nr:phosphotransferase [Pseudomonadota bacterium]
MADISLLARAENISFKVTDDSGKLYTLRLHRPAYHTLEELKSERLWTKALLQAGVHVPEPICARDGQDHVGVDVPQPGEHRHASLSRWVPGEPLMRLIRDGHPQGQLEMHFRKLGALIATMNNQATAWHPPAEFRRHALDADGLMGAQPFWGRFWERSDVSQGERALLLDARDQLHRIFTSYGKDASRYSVIHSDLHPGNALVCGDTLTAIDFDDVAWGWHMYDLAAALNQCQEMTGFGAFQAACLEGYRSVRSVRDEDLAMLPLFLLARDLAEIGWFAARPENATPSQMAAMKNFVVAQCRDFLGGRLTPFAVVQG